MEGNGDPCSEWGDLDDPPVASTGTHLRGDSDPANNVSDCPGTMAVSGFNYDSPWVLDRRHAPLSDANGCGTEHATAGGGMVTTTGRVVRRVNCLIKTME